MHKRSGIQNRAAKNAIWIIGCRIVQSVLALVVTMLSARFLGPSNYGLINYAASITQFILPVVQLGLNSTLVQEIVDHPKREGEILGSALFVSVLSAIAGIVALWSFVSIANPGETVTQIVCLLHSFSLITRALEITQYWFQAKLLSKYTSMSVLAAYVLVSAYKIFLLVTGQEIYLFAIAQGIDYLLIAVSLLVLYRKLGGQRLRVSFRRIRKMLAKSRYYIISGLMVSVFSQTDRIMLTLMAGDTANGLYSAAVACTTLSSFVFVAIIDSARPAVLQSKKISVKAYKNAMATLYAVVFYLSLAQCVFMALLAPWIIDLLYGSQYVQSIPILRIAVWYTTFSYIGAARNVWILAEEKHDILWKANLIGAMGNVLMNLLLIPPLGGYGAALASFLTQFFTNFILGFLLEPIRANNRLLLRGIHPAFCYRQLMRICKRRS